MWSFTKDSDGVGLLEINDIKNPVNMLGAEFVETFYLTLEKIFSENIKGLIITSQKKEFMAGGDLKFLLNQSTKESATLVVQKIHTAFQYLETQGKPVVAAINGSALGGGLELALACHYRVALSDPKIQLGFPEVTLGLLPGAGGTQRLPRLIGIQPSLELLTLGTNFITEKGKALGIINEVVETREDLLKVSKAFILKNPQISQPWNDKKFKVPGGGIQSPQGYQVMAASNAMVTDKTFNNYPAPKAILSCIYEGLQLPFDSALKVETRYFVDLLKSPVAKNMITTLFFGIQECNKGAARPKDIPQSLTKKVGILGAGMMGSGIAYAASKAGISVVLKDVSLEAAQKGKSYSEKICTNLVEKKENEP